MTNIFLKTTLVAFQGLLVGGLLSACTLDKQYESELVRKVVYLEDQRIAPQGVTIKDYAQVEVHNLKRIIDSSRPNQVTIKGSIRQAEKTQDFELTEFISNMKGTSKSPLTVTFGLNPDFQQHFEFYCVDEASAKCDHVAAIMTVSQINTSTQAIERYVTQIGVLFEILKSQEDQELLRAYELQVSMNEHNAIETYSSILTTLLRFYQQKI